MTGTPHHSARLKLRLQPVDIPDLRAAHLKELLHSGRELEA
jgi:hypothetical protein